MMNEKSKELRIVQSKNGFIVSASSGYDVISKAWGFESSESLTMFIKKWSSDLVKERDQDELNDPLKYEKSL